MSIFINSYIFFKNPFEFHFGYVIYIFLLPGFVGKYGINRNLFFIFITLFVTGVVNIILGNNTTALFFKVFTGLTLSYFFYYYVILEFDYDIERLFKWYLTGCYIAALLGFFQFVCFQIGFEWGYRFGFIFNKWGIATGGIFGLRVNSIFAEPTHLASVMSAAFFVSLYNLFRRETYGITRFQSVAIIGIYILSFSGLGQTGIFLTLLLFAVNFGLIRYIVIAIPAGIILFTVLYNNVKDFRERLDGLVGLFSGQKFELGKTHGSSFILYNNYIVATKNFSSNFVFGTGIGSHPVAFDKYSMAKTFKVIGFNSNGADANSMFLRLVSETGLFGVLLFLIIVIKCYVRRDPEYETYHWLVSNGILVMILLNLFRQGHYFLNGFPFFVILYYYNFIGYHAARDEFYDKKSKLLDQDTLDKDEKKIIQ
ncbi:hypothetical protein CNR22_06870 [Sphingobacteriaceae bacterium]|nr:hypothetical protein CNR22_06870 [Sphingobacteriaceae bacterium]